MTRRGVRSALLALAIGAGAGYVCAWLRTPIPWMLGPLFSLAFLRVAGVDVGVPAPVRYGGQWIIGTSLGLYFTPMVVREVAGLWYLLLAGAVFSVAVGYVSALALARFARLDRTTALFASVPGGAAEMAVLGERFGARVDRVAAAQSLRILIVVAVIPAVYTLLGVHGADPYVQGAKTFEPMGFVAADGGHGDRRLRLPSLPAFPMRSCWARSPSRFRSRRCRSTCRRCRRSPRTLDSACSAARWDRAFNAISCRARIDSSAPS